MRQPARLVSSLALAFASFLVTFAVVELAARGLYEPPWTEALVGAKAQGDIWFRDQHGPHDLRDRAYPEPAAPGVGRVLLLGDSFTYGSGVPSGDAIFPSLLESSLADDARFHAIEVLNAGLPATLTADWLELHDRVADPFDPDLVLVVFFLRDGTRTHTMGGFFDPIRREITLRNATSPLYQNSYLFRTFRDRADRGLIGEHYGVAIHNSYFGSAEETAEWRLAQANLVALRDRTLAAGRAFGLVVFPILVSLDDSYPFRDVCDEIQAFAEREGIAVHSLLPDFLGRDAEALWVSQIDQHPNEAGHAVAAAAIRPFASALLRRAQARGRP